MRSLVNCDRWSPQGMLVNQLGVVIALSESSCFSGVGDCRESRITSAKIGVTRGAVWCELKAPSTALTHHARR